MANPSDERGRKEPDGTGLEVMRAGRLRDQLRVLLVVAVAGLGVVAVVLAWRSYDATFERYAERTAADARLMARDVGRLVHAADLLLVQMVDLARGTDWNDPEARAAAAEELRHLDGLLPETFRLRILDARGDVRASSIEGSAAVNVAGRNYFQAHRAGDAGLRLSGLLRDLQDATPIFTMSRRVPDANGDFGGVAAVSFEPRIVGEAYRENALAERAAFVWAHADGRVLVREPSRTGSPDMGEVLAPGLVAGLATAAAGGSRLYSGLPDGIRYLVAVRQVEDYPFYVITGTATDVVVGTWIDGMLPYAVGGTVALLALAAVARRWLAWAAAEDRYRERLALLLAEKDALLDQKELLMREVDHRVKNSLQLVTHLLDLQAALSSDAAVRIQLAEARGRVDAVILLHRSLHGEEAAGRIELAEYLGHLVQGLAEATGVPVEFVHDAQPAAVPNDTALSVGLIVNELVTNALKHAYPGGAGPVGMRLWVEEARLRLRVADDGAGLPPGFDVHAEGNLGMRIVRMLVDGLGGVLRAERRDPGTAFEVVLPRADTALGYCAPVDVGGWSDSKRTTASSSRAAQ